MDAFSDFSQRLKPGRPIKLVIYSDQGSHSVKGVVCSSDPLRIQVREGNSKLAKVGTRAVLLAVDKVQFVKAEAKVVRVDNEDGECTWEFGGANWEELDRRKYARHAMTLEVKLKAVQEKGGETQIIYSSGKTSDLSMGGAWLQVDRTVEKGSLVDFRATSGSGELQILCVVTHVDEKGLGLGVEFMDFLGESRTLLREFLGAAAA